MQPGEEYQFQVEAPDNYYGQMPNQWENQQGSPPMSQQEPQWQERQAAPTPNYQEAPTQQEKQGAKAPIQQPTPEPAPKSETKKPETTQTNGISQAAQQVIDLTNAERRKQGLSDLKADTQLSGVAQKKSDDMQQKNYFSHTSPTYGSPFDMMRDFGVTYKSAGENIAQGQQSPQEVVQAWMNSEGHRKNILNNNFTHIGVGYEQTGKHWTQMFIGK
ncbi:sporulation protein [Bacillus sp. FJAT-49870]|uniref:Sporulation protein n=2 Tax=Lederbergia citri TaxID=2833580 RepID=A0A942TGR8_9BACI|nr:sporulation protein [Lederbergia citri]